jgi:hypothetical protein
MIQTAQLKDMVIDKIYGINDESYLRALEKILDVGKTSERIYYLNDKQRTLINIGKQQISNDEYFSNEELEKEEDEWLNG